MRYRVTGGADGQSGISVGSRRYEPGDTIDLTQSKAQWLIDRGLLEPDGRRGASPEADLVDEPADTIDESEDN